MRAGVWVLECAFAKKLRLPFSVCEKILISSQSFLKICIAHDYAHFRTVCSIASKLTCWSSWRVFMEAGIRAGGNDGFEIQGAVLGSLLHEKE